MKKAPLIASIGITVLVFGVVLVGYLVGMHNRAASLCNTYEMKVKDNSSELDNLWKKINQVAQVSDANKNALLEIFQGYAAARTGTNGGGSLANWIKESVPNVDLSTYKNLQNLIASSRDSWTMRQKELVDIAREYNQGLSVLPDKMLLSMMGFEKIDPKVITSTRTENAFIAGKDDDVSLPVGKK